MPRVAQTVLFCLFALSCSRPAPRPSTPPASDARVRALADAFLNGWFDRNPDQATLYGVPGRHHDKLPDNSLAALQAWQAREDGWITEARAIDPAAIAAPPLRATYAIVREALEGSIAARVCRPELWTVSQMVNGWQIQYGYLVTIQPVGTDDARREALARWTALPEYVDTEIANLREGVRLGYTAPKGNVRIVIDQMRTLVSSPIRESPFDSPAVRDNLLDFQHAFDALVRDRINPAFERYRTFLEKQYLPVARDRIAVSAQPDGAACYAAAVRSHSGLS